MPLSLVFGTAMAFERSDVLKDLGRRWREFKYRALVTNADWELFQ